MLAKKRVEPVFWETNKKFNLRKVESHASGQKKNGQKNQNWKYQNLLNLINEPCFLCIVKYSIQFIRDRRRWCKNSYSTKYLKYKNQISIMIWYVEYSSAWGGSMSSHRNLDKKIELSRIYWSRNRFVLKGFESKQITSFFWQCKSSYL